MAQSLRADFGNNSMTNLRARIEKLEAADSKGVVILWRHHTEPDEQAEARLPKMSLDCSICWDTACQ